MALIGVCFISSVSAEQIGNSGNMIVLCYEIGRAKFGLFARQQTSKNRPGKRCSSCLFSSPIEKAA